MEAKPRERASTPAMPVGRAAAAGGSPLTKRSTPRTSGRAAAIRSTGEPRPSRNEDSDPTERAASAGPDVPTATRAADTERRSSRGADWASVTPPSPISATRASASTTAGATLRVGREATRGTIERSSETSSSARDEARSDARSSLTGAVTELFEGAARSRGRTEPSIASPNAPRSAAWAAPGLRGARAAALRRSLPGGRLAEGRATATVEGETSPACASANGAAGTKRDCSGTIAPWRARVTPAGAVARLRSKRRTKGACGSISRSIVQTPPSACSRRAAARADIPRRRSDWKATGSPASPQLNRSRASGTAPLVRRAPEPLCWTSDGPEGRALAADAPARPTAGEVSPKDSTSKMDGSARAASRRERAAVVGSSVSFPDFARRSPLTDGRRSPSPPESSARA
jgi:hypothetical protein